MESNVVLMLTTIKDRITLKKVMKSERRKKKGLKKNTSDG
jgi:hypothetical protein